MYQLKLSVFFPLFFSALFSHCLSKPFLSQRRRQTSTTTPRPENFGVAFFPRLAEFPTLGSCCLQSLNCLLLSPRTMSHRCARNAFREGRKSSYFIPVIHRPSAGIGLTDEKIITLRHQVRAGGGAGITPLSQRKDQWGNENHIALPGKIDPEQRSKDKPHRLHTPFFLNLFTDILLCVQR